VRAGAASSPGPEEEPVRTDAKIQRLSTIPLFARLSRRELQRVAELCTEIITEPDRVLCVQGEIGHEFFVVEDGTFKVASHGEEIALLGPGDFFGELALLDGGTRTATITAVTPGHVLVVGQREFKALLHDEPSVAVAMLPGIGQRIRRIAELAAHPVGA
jgi:CRP/FNR family transcriptional regulator, cyclic AMP receptor protein